MYIAVFSFFHMVYTVLSIEAGKKNGLFLEVSQIMKYLDKHFNVVSENSEI